MSYKPGITRRQFISSGLAAAVLTRFSSPAFTFAQALNGPLPPVRSGQTLIHISLDGGADGLFTNGPLPDTDIARALAAVRPNLTPGRDEFIDCLNGRIGLNRTCWGPLEDVFRLGEGKIVQGAGFINSSMSHEAAATAVDNATIKEGSSEQQRGLFASMKKMYGMDDLRVFGINAEPSPSLNCEKACPRFYDLGGFSYRGPKEELGGHWEGKHWQETMREVNKARMSSSHPAQKIHALALEGADAAMSLVAEMNSEIIGGYYYNAEGRYKNLYSKNLADLMKAVLYGKKKDADAITLLRTAWGGFDTHAGQMSFLPQTMNQISEALAGFIQDLKDHSLFDKVTIVITSEFGRTLMENADKSTDHARAGSYYVFSGRCNGKGNNSVVGPEIAVADIARNFQQAGVPCDFFFANILQYGLKVPSDHLPYFLPDLPAQIENLGIFT